MIRLIFSLFISLCLTCPPVAYGGGPAVQVELTAQKSEISFDESEVPVDIKIINISAADLQFSDLSYFTGPSIRSAGYRIHLTTDDPAFELSLNQTTTMTSGPLPVITLKPRQSFSAPMRVRIGTGRLGESVTFKVGFRLLENSTPTWSNPATVKLRAIDPLIPRVHRELNLKFESSMKDKEMTRSGMVHIRITNTSDVTQRIVGPGIHALPDTLHLANASVSKEASFSSRWAFAPIRSDNRSIFVDTGSSSCNDYFGKHDGLTLEPGKIWEADCAIYYEGGVITQSRPVTFRMGIVSSGQEPLWSSDLTVRVMGTN